VVQWRILNLDIVAWWTVNKTVHSNTNCTCDRTLKMLHPLYPLCWTGTRHSGCCSVRVRLQLTASCPLHTHTRKSRNIETMQQLALISQALALRTSFPPLPVQNKLTANILDKLQQWRALLIDEQLKREQRCAVLRSTAIVHTEFTVLHGCETCSHNEKRTQTEGV
jgi:hypothetical protein